MIKDFKKERTFVLDLAKQGIDINLKLNPQQKKYIKNLLLFALMNASSNETVTDKNFIKLVNKLFKTYLVKILKDAADDDDDDDWETSISVELNKIIANDRVKNLVELQEVFTPAQIFSFLKKYTTGVSQKDLLNKLRSLREAKNNYRETPEEAKKREHNRKEYTLAMERQRMMERGSRTR